MAKYIKVTDEIINEIKEDFSKALESMKLSDGKISYSKSLTTVDRRAQVVFTECAWTKVQLLVQTAQKEIAWHGIAQKVNENYYLISDIIVYPQEVAGATVTTDQEEYQKWLYNLPDDTFNNLRMQGHSHVNMGVSPSSTDTTLYSQMLAQLDDDMFYIFMIHNKKGDITVKVYDMADNILFETDDVDISVADGEYGIIDFLSSVKNNVTEAKYTPPATTYKSYATSYKQPVQTSTSAAAPKQTKPTESKKDEEKGDKLRKGKRKESKASQGYSGSWPYIDDDDDDWYYKHNAWW